MPLVNFSKLKNLTFCFSLYCESTKATFPLPICRPPLGFRTLYAHCFAFKEPKFNYGNVDFTDSNNSAEIDPIKTDTSDSSFLFDNDDAIIVDLKRGNSNK